MTQALSIIKLILALLPSIIDAVRAIESALPVSNQGALKLALLRDTLQAGWSVANDAVTTFDAAWPAIEKTISAVVGLFNRTGAFVKS